MSDQAGNESEKREEGRRPETLLIGLGASAGGLEALGRFFAAVPSGCGLSFVVVQHLEPTHPSMLPELLARNTSLLVVPATDGLRPLAGHIYVIRAGTLLTVENGSLKVTPCSSQAARQAPIDKFFRALAQDRGETAVGILLSGAGHDGTVGLRAIKERGGMTMAQSPDTAQHASMAEGAINAGLVDHVMEVEQMPATLLAHAAQLALWQDGGPPPLPAQLPAALPAICSLLHQRTGHDFSRYKSGTLLRRIRRRLQIHHVTCVNEYLKLLGGDARESEGLLKDLLIGVTQFFRDPEAFHALAVQVLPRMVQAKSADVPLRAWVAGCASGEEAYSLGILLLEHLERQGLHRFVQIFATDLDPELLAEARAGRYRADIAEHVSPERLERFFVREGAFYQANKDLREMCIFSQHSVIRDPPFSSLDLISCRNLLIYLEAGLQQKLIPLFHYALRPGGHLMLGPSEGLAANSELFETVDKRLRIFRRREAVNRLPIEFPLVGRAARLRAGAPTVAAPGRESPTPREWLAACFERLVLEEYASPALVVNGQGDIRLLAGPVARYLQLPAGAPTTNLLESVRGRVRVELRAALLAAAESGGKVVRDGVPMEQEDGLRLMRLLVRPMPFGDGDAKLFCVVLQEQAAALPEGNTGTTFSAEPPAMQQMESELRATRAELRLAVEELESANEELKSSNEELISTNEELQSANEEMQTSREELQSLNEELETVNTELRLKVDELGEANSDLQNLFASTQIATLFLDRELCITRFTPAASVLFRLLDGDVGRPLADLASRFAGEDLVAVAAEVLGTSTPVERQVRDSLGSWFVLRVLPYRTMENLIAGVVITLVDTSALKRAEEEVRRHLQLIHLSHDAIFVWQPPGGIELWNRGAHELYGFTRQEALGQRFYQLLRTVFPVPLPEIEAELAESGCWSGELHHRAKDGRTVIVVTNMQLVRGDDGVERVLETSRDVTEQRRIAAERDRLAAQRALALDAASMGWWHYDPGSQVASYDEQYTKIFGLSGSQRANQEMLELLHPEDLPRVGKAVEAALDPVDPQPYAIEYRVNRPDGTLCWVEAHGIASFEGEGAARKATSFVGTVADVTERKQAEDVLRANERRFATAFLSGPAPMGIADVETKRLVEVNDAWVSLYGFSREEAVGRTSVELGIVASDDDRLRVLAQATDLEKRQAVELRVRGKNGTQLDVMARTAAIELNGRPCLITTSIDFTEVKRYQQERERLLAELQRRTAELDATLASMSTGVVIFGADGRGQFANQAAQEILRYTAEERAATDLASRAQLLAFRSEDGSPIAPGETPIARALRGEASQGVIMRVPRGEQDVWISVSAAPIRAPSGELLGAVSVISDLTQRKLMDARMAWLASFPERNALPITELSLDGQLLYVNPSARALFPDMEDKGTAHAWLADWKQAVGRLQESDALMAERTVMVGQAVYHQSLHLLPEAARVRIYGRDITAARRMEDALRESNEKLREADLYKNEFLAMLSHELRNPLAPIRNSLHVLERATPGSEPARRAQTIIERQTEHMTRLVDDLLDVTRISRGKIQLQRKVLDLDEVMRRTVEDMRSLFAKSGVALDVALPEEELVVDADGTRLAQAVGNLLQNAVKFTDRGGRVTVRLTRDGDNAVLRVRDTGVGIGADMLSHLFEPFMQADRTLDRSHGGLGLGLALVKGLVALHGGEVSAASEGLGKGTEFVIRLPLRQGVVADPPIAAAMPSTKQRRRVLVIEDNLDAASSLCEVLELGEHEVAVAYSGPEGLAKAREMRPEVILCDIGLPGMDGYAVARALRADDSLKAVRLVALTGYALPEDLQRAQEAGFDQHLAKPPSLERLQELLGQLAPMPVR